VQGQTGALHGATAALPEIARSVVERYVEDGIDISLHDASCADVEVDDVALRRVIANQVDNAIAHGRTPIRIELSGDAEETLLMVFDAGTGIAVGSFQHLLQPFVRLQPEVAANGLAASPWASSRKSPSSWAVVLCWRRSTGCVRG